MITLFIGAAVVALFFLIAAVLLGGYGAIAGLGVCLLVMTGAAKYEEYKKQKAMHKWQTTGASYNAKVWGA